MLAHVYTYRAHLHRLRRSSCSSWCSQPQASAAPSAQHASHAASRYTKLGLFPQNTEWTLFQPESFSSSKLVYMEDGAFLGNEYILNH